MTDTVSLIFKTAPEHEVVVTAPSIYTIGSALWIEYDLEGEDAQAIPFHNLQSLHITKAVD